MNIFGHISGLSIPVLQFLDADPDPGFGTFLSNFDPWVPGWKNSDPGSGDFFLPLDPGWKKFQSQDPGSEKNSPDIIFEYLLPYQFFGLKILEFFDADPGSWQPWIRDTGWNQIGSGINILDPQHR